MKRKIIFLSEGEAFYPSKIASKKFFISKGYDVEDITRDCFDESRDYSNAVLWIMMGFYAREFKGNFRAVVHEYRSQSTGVGRRIKDLIKKQFNHKPSYRLFQSEKIRKTFEREDGVPSGILELGVPSEIEKFKIDPLNLNFEYDFCYIGSISDERNITSMLNGFISAYGDKKSIVLVGDIRDGIDKKFAINKNIYFVGRVRQEEAFNYVNNSEFAVCYFPSHAPHCFQPPTKLFEYAALGKKIIANDSPSNLKELERLNINAKVISGSFFPSYEELLDLSDNSNFDATSIFFDNLIKKSGIEDFIDDIFK